MHISKKVRSLTTAFLAITGVASASSNTQRATWPDGPFTTSGRWINDATGAHVTYIGVNWPGSLDTMIPEGLQYQSIEDIVSKVKGLGMNAIRLTYATEMVDEYYDNGERDVTIEAALTNVLGDDGTAVYDKVIANNPSLGGNTTRLQVYDAIAEECAKQEIYVHLDNHISQAGWCCNPLDGNSWWGDTHFNVDNWTRGLSFMAEHGKSWSSLMSMSLRNELRLPLSNPTLAARGYTWKNWYKHVQEGAEAIHAANPDVLIFLSGMDSDKNLTVVVDGTELSPGTQTFNRDDFEGYGDKLVLELHAYDNILGTGSGNCSSVNEDLIAAGFDGLSDDAVNQFPVLLTEFGMAMDASLTAQPYIGCLLDFMAAQKAGWFIWSISGSYYIREETPDRDENWGLLNHDWSDWRSPEFTNGTIVPAVQATLESDGMAQAWFTMPSEGGSSDADDSPESRATHGPIPGVTSAMVFIGLVMFWMI